MLAEDSVPTLDYVAAAEMIADLQDRLRGIDHPRARMAVAYLDPVFGEIEELAHEDAA